jgi:hypothetical protein
LICGTVYATLDAMNPSDAAARKNRAAALAAAEAELEAAIAILFDRRCVAYSACVHVVRGWQALARLKDGAREESLASRWLTQLDAHDFDFRSPAEQAEWERSLLQVAAASASFDGAGSAAPSKSDLLVHCKRLERTLRRASARLRIETPAGRRKRQVAVVAAVLAVLAAAAYEHFGLRVRGPWSGRYYSNPSLIGVPALRQDADVFFDWGDDAPMAGMPRDDFSVSWDTCFRVAEPQKWRFVLGSDDGSRFAIDGKTLIDNWGPHDFRMAEGEADLAPGVHRLTVSFFDKSGAARIALRAGRSGGPLQPLPAHDLASPRQAADGSPFCPDEAG